MTGQRETEKIYNDPKYQLSRFRIMFRVPFNNLLTEFSPQYIRRGLCGYRVMGKKSLKHLIEFRNFLQTHQQMIQKSMVIKIENYFDVIAAHDQDAN